MKKIINWFRDLFYNFTDYLIILCVVLAVAAILIWRFDILFNIKIDKDTIAPVPPIEISDNPDKDNEEDNKNNNENNDNDDSTNNPDTKDDNTDISGNNPDTSDDNKDNQDNKPDDNNTSNIAAGAEVSFNIPSGSFPSKIADILLASGLIDDKQAFLTRCVELKLDTKLKSGDFKIKKGTALDDIIKAIAK